MSTWGNADYYRGEFFMKVKTSKFNEPVLKQKKILLSIHISCIAKTFTHLQSPR